MIRSQPALDENSDHIRNTMLGGLVLGFGFLWTDLVYYAVGIGVGTAIERGIRR